MKTKDRLSREGRTVTKLTTQSELNRHRSANMQIVNPPSSPENLLNQSLIFQKISFIFPNLIPWDNEQRICCENEKVQRFNERATDDDQ